MDALCRDLGSRSRADAVVATAPVGGGAAADAACTPAEAALRAELAALKPWQLKQRARDAGADAQALDATDDAEAPCEALVVLVVRLALR